ncbi:unnamed protein product, partial [Mesorhabditis spiculigera]
MAAWGAIRPGVDAIERGRKFAGMIDTILKMGEPIGTLLLKSVQTTLEADSPEVQAGNEFAVWMKERDQKMVKIAHSTGFVWDDQTVYDWNSAIRNRFIPVQTMFKLRFLLPEPADVNEDFLKVCRKFDYFEKLRVIAKYFVDACPMPTLVRVQRTVNALKAFRRIEAKCTFERYLVLITPKMMPELMADYHVHKSKYILNLTSDTELINMLRQDSKIMWPLISADLDEFHPAPKMNRFGKKLLKVALTGGPCAGKSTAMQELCERIDEEFGNEWQVFKAAEASSLLYSGGVARSQLNDIQLEQWQLDMLSMIIRIEAVFEKIAENEPTKHTLILCDRGALDPKVFTPEPMWTNILKKLQTDEETLYSRYDQVIQLQTAPRCNYTNKNKFRREDYEHAAKINKEFTRVWRHHPNFVNILDNRDDSWEEKLAETWVTLKSTLEKTSAE